MKPVCSYFATQYIILVFLGHRLWTWVGRMTNPFVKEFWRVKKTFNLKGWEIRKCDDLVLGRQGQCASILHCAPNLGWPYNLFSNWDTCEGERGLVSLEYHHTPGLSWENQDIQLSFPSSICTDMSTQSVHIYSFISSLNHEPNPVLETGGYRISKALP